MSRMTCLSISFCANNLMFIAQAAEFGLSKHRWPETSERQKEFGRDHSSTCSSSLLLPVFVGADS